MQIPAATIAELLVRLIIGVPTLLIAGWSIARLVVPATDEPPTDEFPADESPAAQSDVPLLRLSVALGWGFGVVPTFAFFAHLLAGIAVTELSIFAVVAIQLAVITAYLSVSETFETETSESGTSESGTFEPGTFESRLPWRGIGEVWRHHRGPVLTAAVIFVAWFIKHDGSIPSGSCVTQAAAVASGWDPTSFDLLRGNLGDNRLGNAGVIAGSMAVFGQWAFRVLYGLLAAMLAIGGWLLGRSVTPRRWAGWLGLLLLPLNPYVASLPLIDENLLTLATTATFLPLAMASMGRPSSSWPRWVVIGALYGLAATMRHPLVLAFPALVVAARRPRAIASLIAGTAALTCLEHAHHVLAFGSLFKFESNAYFMPQTYSLFGAEFRYNGMLNWPVHDALIRTPHNPWPTLLMWPLAVADHLGYLAFSALLVGFVAAWRRRRRALFWLLWFVPVMASLAVQEAWDYPNKMGVILVVFVPLVVWVIEGVAAIARRPRAGLVAFVAMLVATVAAVAAVRGVNVPADTRYFAHYQLPAAESESYLQTARDRASDVDPWPDFSRISRYGAVFNPRKLTVIGRENEQSPAWGWHPGELPARGDPIVVHLDLRQPPWHRNDVVRLASPGARVDVDLVTRPQRQLIGPLKLPWEDHNAWLTAIDGPNLTVLELGFLTRDSAACDPAKDQRKCRFYGTFDRGIDAHANAAAKVIEPAGPGITIRIPAGGLSFAVSINERGNVVELWKVLASRDGISTDGPYAFWHN